MAPSLKCFMLTSVPNTEDRTSHVLLTWATKIVSFSTLTTCWHSIMSELVLIALWRVMVWLFTFTTSWARLFMESGCSQRISDSRVCWGAAVWGCGKIQPTSSLKTVLSLCLFWLHVMSAAVGGTYQDYSHTVSLLSMRYYQALTIPTPGIQGGGGEKW